MTLTRRILGSLAASATLAAALPARAAVVSYTASAVTRGDESAPNRLPGFDDALGTLTGAAVSFSGAVSGTASSSSTSAQPASITVSPYLLLGGLAEFGRSLRVDLPALAVSPTYTATGGYRASWSETIDTAPLALPLGAIGEDADAVAYTIAGGYGIFPNPATFYDNGAPFTGTATVFYTYTPTTPDGPTGVPEPASMALLGVGLAGLVAARRRAGPAVSGATVRQRAMRSGA